MVLVFLVVLFFQQFFGINSLPGEEVFMNPDGIHADYQFLDYITYVREYNDNPYILLSLLDTAKRDLPYKKYRGLKIYTALITQISKWRELGDLLAKRE